MKLYNYGKKWCFRYRRQFSSVKLHERDLIQELKRGKKGEKKTGRNNENDYIKKSMKEEITRTIMKGIKMKEVITRKLRYCPKDTETVTKILDLGKYILGNEKLNNNKN